MSNRRIEPGEVGALADLLRGLRGLADMDVVVGTFNIEERLTGRILARVCRVDKMYRSFYEVEFLGSEQ